jgi:beta-lactamase superfamily II metal-dependent hydrolase
MRKATSTHAASAGGRLFTLLVLALVSTVCAGRPAHANPLNVVFFDVGQGDAALITTPSGKRILIDGGPPEAEMALRSKLGRAPLDLVLLSHRHADHLGGLPAIIEQPGAKLFIDSTFPHPSPLYDHLVRALAAQKVTVRNAEAGRVIDLGDDAKLTLLSPPEPPITGTRSDVNANSVVARLDYGKFSVLFTGDAEAETERQLLASGRPLGARVVKVPHHGSGYSSTAEFAFKVRPEYAIMSVGAHNRYGHPDEQTVRRWERLGAKVYRTDLSGDVTVTSDGNSIEVTTAHSGPMADPPKPAPRHAGASPPVAESSTAHGAYVASRRSPVFHRPDCANASTIVPSNLIGFATREEALASGKRPAQDCHP